MARTQQRQSGGFSLDGYVDVAERIREFKAKHPDGSLQPVEWRIVEAGDQLFVYYQAAAYRSPDDQRPGIGAAWEPFPGKTPYTRDSELQNAETSAWGRAIVAALAADTQKIASAQEVRNRTADREEGRDGPLPVQLADFKRLCAELGVDTAKDKAGFVSATVGREAKWSELSAGEATVVVQALLDIQRGEKDLQFDNAGRPFAAEQREPFEVVDVPPERAAEIAAAADAHPLDGAPVPPKRAARD